MCRFFWESECDDCQWPLLWGSWTCVIVTTTHDTWPAHLTALLHEGKHNKKDVHAMFIWCWASGCSAENKHCPAVLFWYPPYRLTIPPHWSSAVLYEIACFIWQIISAKSWIYILFVRVYGEDSCRQASSYLIAPIIEKHAARIELISMCTQLRFYHFNYVTRFAWGAKLPSAPAPHRFRSQNTSIIDKYSTVTNF